MAYYIINNFAAGLDLRRSSLTAPVGTLRSLKNLHLTPGGEIEKRFAFVKFATVDPASKGLIEVNQKLYVFGPNGPGIVEPPADWTVGTLQLATGGISYILDYDLFNNKVFCILVDTNGAVQHFYNGVSVAGANGYYCRTYKTKMFTVAGSVMYFSAVGAADDWAGTGSGFIDLSLEDSDMTDCQALEVYYDKLAILSSTATQLWSIDPDPLQTQYDQTLRQAGTIAPRSVLQYGSGDVLYIAPDGIRSLRARNASLAASVSDVGSPLDPVMQQLLRDQGTGFMSSIIALLQPVTGRFWIILPDRVYILSAFPGPKVTAWSQYDPTDASGNPINIVAATTYRKHVVVRDSNNNIYAYGGATDTGVVYDNCPVEIVFPFHAGEEPATFKVFHGLDAACTGEWDVYASYDPDNDTAEDYLGKFTGPTFLKGRFPMQGHSTHMSLRMRSSVNGPLTLSNMIVHYDKAESG
jgi:hypothetical protein